MNNQEQIDDLIKGVILHLIDRLVKKHGFRPTGKILGISGGVVQKIHQRKWYPKTQQAENNLLEALIMNKKILLSILQEAPDGDI